MTGKKARLLKILRKRNAAMRELLRDITDLRKMLKKIIVTFIVFSRQRTLKRIGFKL